MAVNYEACNTIWSFFTTEVISIVRQDSAKLKEFETCLTKYLMRIDNSSEFVAAEDHLLMRLRCFYRIAGMRSAVERALESAKAYRKEGR